MIIWLSLIFPILTAIILYSFKQTREKLAWWEVPAKLVILTLVILSFKACSNRSVKNDTERLMDYVVAVEHHTYWNRWIVETCSEEYQCGTDDDGNPEYCTRYYDCSYEKEYDPYTKVTTNTGRTYTINEGYEPNSRYSSKPKYFLRLMKQFSEDTNLIDTEKSRIHTRYDNRHTPDIKKRFIGNVYKIKWDKKFETIEDRTWEQTYENRVLRSNSIYTPKPVDSSDISRFNLKEYPSNMNDVILNYNSHLDKYVRRKNALIASKKQVKVYYVIFKNQPRRAGLLQEQYWQKGNKNEVVITIGIDDDNNIEWSHVFSWSKKSEFKIKIRNNILGYGKLSNKNFKKIIDYDFKEIENGYKRREFVEFSYLTIEPSTGLIITAFIFSFILSVGFSIYIYVNEF